MNPYFITILGLLMLIKGANFLVKGAAKISILIGIPKFIVSITIVAFCTSAPELIISIKSALSNHYEIAFGNVIGSNIANISLVLGTSIALLPITINKKQIIADWVVMMITTLAFIGLSFYGVVNRISGVGLLIFFGAYLFHLIKKTKKQKDKQTKTTASRKEVLQAIFFLILGGVGLSYGSVFLLRGATEIARLFNVSEYVIGITVVAIGTSLPELVTSIIAAIKKESDISIGNIIGSNIFNILSVIGITSIVKPMIFPKDFSIIDIYWLLGTSILLFIILFIGKKASRGKGVLLLGIYAAYIVTSI